MSMTLVDSFLRSHADVLQPFGVSDVSQVSAVVVTPRFETSRHVIFLIFPRESPDPILVVKVPRVDDAGGFLAREAENLEAVHRVDEAQVRSVPRLVAYEVFQEEVLLVESAVTGRLMRPSVVRREFSSCLEATSQWLIDFHKRTIQREAWNETAFLDLIDRPLDVLQQRIPPDPRSRRLLTRTRSVVDTLADGPLPLVFEHGDLGSPNLFLLPQGGIGVVDWELSRPRSLPVVDLFFFLAFMGFARESATTVEQCVTAFRHAFFGTTAWTRPHVLRYAKALEIPSSALKPLFLLCWSRYVANVVARTAYAGQEPIGASWAEAMQKERYWSLWQYAVDHLDEIDYGN